MSGSSASLARRIDSPNIETFSQCVMWVCMYVCVCARANRQTTCIQQYPSPLSSPLPFQLPASVSCHTHTHTHPHPHPHPHTPTHTHARTHTHTHTHTHTFVHTHTRTHHTPHTLLHSTPRHYSPPLPLPVPPSAPPTHLAAA